MAAKQVAASIMVRMEVLMFSSFASRARLNKTTSQVSVMQSRADWLTFSEPLVNSNGIDVFTFTLRKSCWTRRVGDECLTKKYFPPFPSFSKEGGPRPPKKYAES